VVDATSIIDYTFTEFRNGIQDIAKQIEESGFAPDYLVGIVRGGSVPAVYLSHKLKIPVVMVAWNTRDNTEFGTDSVTWIPEDLLAGKRVLIVDDIVDGGQTIKELLEDWQKSVLKPIPHENIRIAAMWYNTAQDVAVDFYHKTIDRDSDSRWIVFDWEA
jgi:hypoxanthine phosphoribosyltransferase